jgi:ribosomal protein S18 acetylase RimI-like enzyme
VLICEDKDSFEDIYNYLLENDSNMTPPLSKRVNIETYSRKLFDKAKQFWIKKDQKAIGFAACYVIESEMYISSISICSGYKGLGLGKKLLEYIISFGRKNELKKIILEVQPENKNVINFYKKFNFNLIQSDSKLFMKLLILES